MAKMCSPAGDMDMSIASIDAKEDQMVITGKFGMWDADVYVGPREMRQMIRMAFKPSVISFVARLPFIGRGHEEATGG